MGAEFFLEQCHHLTIFLPSDQADDPLDLFLDLDFSGLVYILFCPQSLDLLGCIIYWQVPAIALATGIEAKVLVYISLILIGFCIYGPVALVSIQALNLVPKNAAGTAAGFVGLSGYLIGDSLLSKIIVGGIADQSWNMANFTMVIGALLGILLCAMTLPSEKK